MHKKKTLILAFAILMPLNQVSWAQEAASEAVSSTITQEPATETESMTGQMSESVAASESGANRDESTVTNAQEDEPAQASEITDETAAQKPIESTRPGLQRDTMRDHWKAREEQYQALRKRAEEAGVMLPEQPPWRSEMHRLIRPGLEERMAHRNEMMPMSQEERDAYRQQRYQEMRTRANARQQALDEEWAKHQKVIQGMTDEERAACHAMHRRHMGMMRGGGTGPDCGAMEHQGCGMYQGDYGPRMMPGYYGPGYGYGSGPYAPQNFWDPNQ